MSFSYLGKHELAYLTEKMILAAKRPDEKRERLRKKLAQLNEKLASVESGDERLSQLKEKLSKLDGVIKGL